MKKTILNFLTFSLGSVSAALFSLITTPIVTRLIIPEEYGQYSLFLLLSNIFIMIALFGLDQAITRYYYEVNIETLYMQVYKILNISFVISSLTILCVIYIFDFTFFKNVYLIIAFIIFMISTVNFRIQNLKLRMEQQAFFYSCMIFISKLLEFICTLTALYLFNNNAKTLISAIVISMLISNLFNYYINKRIIKIKGYDDNKITKKELLMYSYPLMISGVFTMIFQVSDKILLNYFTTGRDFGIYTASFKLAALLTIIQQAFSLFWTPFIMKHYSSGTNVKHILNAMFELLSLILFSMFIFLVLIKDVLILFLGSEYRSGAIFLPFFYFLPIMYVLSEITIVGVYFNSKTKKIILITISTLFVSLLSSSILSYYFQSIGASISLAITYTYFFISRTFIGLKEYYFKINIFSITYIIISMFVISFLSIKLENLHIFIISFIIFSLYLLINSKQLKSTIILLRGM